MSKILITRDHTATDNGSKYALENVLQSGADVCELRPVSPAVLAEHIAAIKRHPSNAAWRLNLFESRLFAPDGQSELLSLRELTLFELLSRSSGHLASRQNIVQAFGKNWIDYDERILSQMISRLRRRWFTRVRTKLPLQTERQIGYRFLEDIQLVDRCKNSSGAENSTPGWLI
jgi:DNA-binding response OmpR family regulator